MGTPTLHALRTLHGFSLNRKTIGKGVPGFRSINSIDFSDPILYTGTAVYSSSVLQSIRANNTQCAFDLVVMQPDEALRYSRR